MSTTSNDAIALSLCDDMDMLIAENHRLRGENEALRQENEHLSTANNLLSLHNQQLRHNQKLCDFAMHAMESDRRRLTEELEARNAGSNGSL